MIVGFNDTEHFFLNNKYSCKIYILGRHFGNAEAAYQAHKTKEPQIINIFTTLDAVSSQSIGRSVKTYDGWENDRVRVMLLVVFEKFRQNPQILDRLLNTENQKLVAVSISKEKFWGCLDGEGENVLGKILMHVRQYFKSHSIDEHEKLFKDLECIHNRLNILQTTIKDYGILYRDEDLKTNEEYFNDCILYTNKLKSGIEDFIKFFLVDVESLTEATSQFID